MDPILIIKDLRTEFSTPRGIVHALDGVNLEIREGEVLGLVGESGCGKSVTALSLMYLIPDPPGRITGGEIWFRGTNLLAGIEKETYRYRDWRGRTRIGRREALTRRHRARMNRIRGREISMIFQEPMSSLNPVLAVGYQIAEVLLYQRRKDLCETLLSRKPLTPEALDLFREVLSNPDATRRERLLADFCLQTGLSVRKVADIVEKWGVPREARLDQVQRLAPRLRPWHRYFLKLLRDLDALELELRAREWRILSGTAQAEDHGMRFRIQTDYRSKRSLYKALMAIPILRGILMKPIQEEARRRVLGLLKMVRVPEPQKVFTAYPHELSGGMQQRVMIAMALACDPLLMVADEPTTALDVTTQAQILKLVTDLRKRLNSAILYITHDLAVIAEVSDRVAVMYAGKVVEDATVDELFSNPLHPYTQGLLESILSLDKPVAAEGQLATIPGTVPDLVSPPTGCRFHPRCKFAMERCTREEPRLLTVAKDHKVACFLHEPGGTDALQP